MHQMFYKLLLVLRKCYYLTSKSRSYTVHSDVIFPVFPSRKYQKSGLKILMNSMGASFVMISVFMHVLFMPVHSDVLMLPG